MVDTSSPTDAPADPRIAVARRIVLRIACSVGFIFFVAVVFGVYHCATDRPARELFFAPENPPPER
jgi:hypothetical protein